MLSREIYIIFLFFIKVCFIKFFRPPSWYWEIYEAVKESNYKKVESLIKKGADPNAKYELYEYNITLLHIACKKSDIKMVKLLLEKGADPFVRTDLGNTPLFYAAWGDSDNINIVSLLISKGLSVNEENEAGETPLHYSAIKGNAKIAEYLILKGCDVNKQDIDGNTPLYLAIQNYNNDVVGVLLRNGADPFIRNKEGKIGYTFLSENYSQEMQKVFSKFGYPVLDSLLLTADRIVIYPDTKKNCINDSDILYIELKDTILQKFIKYISLYDTIEYKCGYEEGYIYFFKNDTLLASGDFSLSYNHINLEINCELEKLRPFNEKIEKLRIDKNRDLTLRKFTFEGYLFMSKILDLRYLNKNIDMK